MRRSVFILALMALSWSTLPLDTAHAVSAAPPDPSWQTDDIVRTVAFGNGAIYLGGEFTHVRPPGADPGVGEVVREHAAALNRKTGDLLRWNPKVDGIVWAIAVWKSRVYLGGNFDSVGGKLRSNLAAVDATTGDVLNWAPRANGEVRTFRLDAGGQLYVGGSFSKVNGASRQRLAKLDRKGELTPWAPTVGQVGGDPCPPRCSPVVFSIDLSTDGKTVYFGGHFGKVNGSNRNEVAAVDAGAGKTVRPWNPDVYAPTNCPTCIPNETHRVYRVIITDTKAYMCGGFWKVWHQQERAFNVLVTNLTDGHPDLVFAAADDGDTTGCELRGDVLYLGGHFNYVGAACSPNPPAGTITQKCTADNATTRHHVAAVDARTGALLPWRPSANSNHGVWAIQKGPGSIVFIGHFTRMGGVDQEGIARYSAHLARLWSAT
jgi:hypothetical protein